MRIATFNVLHGSPHRADGRPADPTSAQVDGAGAQQPLADAVAALDVDVLALQELDRYQARSGDVDQAEVAATAMGAVDHGATPRPCTAVRSPAWAGSATATRPSSASTGLKTPRCWR